MVENKYSGLVIDSCFNIHKLLGPGLFESVYEEILFRELTDIGLNVERQKGIPVFWKEQKLDLGFRADLIIENKLIVEIKSVEAIAPVHKKQVLTYMRLLNLRLGLLINFNEELMKYGITRIIDSKFHAEPQRTRRDFC